MIKAENTLADDPSPEKIEQIVHEIESLALRLVKRGKYTESLVGPERFELSTS